MTCCGRGGFPTPNTDDDAADADDAADDPSAAKNAATAIANFMVLSFTLRLGLFYFGLLTYSLTRKIYCVTIVCV